jgi:hypothetical protein
MLPKILVTCLLCIHQGLATPQLRRRQPVNRVRQQQEQQQAVNRIQQPQQPVVVTNQQQFCQGDDRVYVEENQDSCNQFYQCANGTITLQTCENGLLFDREMALTDAVHNYCVYNWKVDCGSRPRDDTPISSPGCEYRFGIFPEGDGCRQRYIQCALGVGTKVPCENENSNIPTTLMLSYDVNSHSCDWPDLLLNIGCNPQEMFQFQCPVTRNFVGTRNELYAPFPRFTVEGNNKTYLICVDNQPRLQSCGALDSWDPETLECTRPGSFFG